MVKGCLKKKGKRGVNNAGAKNEIYSFYRMASWAVSANGCPRLIVAQDYRQAVD